MRVVICFLVGARVINEEVRHIIEAELVSDEELLWAEKVDAEQVDAFIQSKIRSDKLWIPVFCVVIFMFSKLLIDAFPLDCLLYTSPSPRD